MIFNSAADVYAYFAVAHWAETHDGIDNPIFQDQFRRYVGGKGWIRVIGPGAVCVSTEKQRWRAIVRAMEGRYYIRAFRREGAGFKPVFPKDAPYSVRHFFDEREAITQAAIEVEIEGAVQGFTHVKEIPVDVSKSHGGGVNVGYVIDDQMAGTAELYFPFTSEQFDEKLSELSELISGLGQQDHGEDY